MLSINFNKYYETINFLSLFLCFIYQPDAGQKDEIYWKRSVSSGRVRREPQTSSSSTYQRETNFLQQRNNLSERGMFHSDQGDLSPGLAASSPRAAGSYFPNSRNAMTTPPIFFRDQSLHGMDTSNWERMECHEMDDQSVQNFHTSKPFDFGKQAYQSPFTCDLPDLTSHRNYDTLLDEPEEDETRSSSPLFAPKNYLLHLGIGEGQKRGDTEELQMSGKPRDDQYSPPPFVQREHYKHSPSSPACSGDIMSLYSSRMEGGHPRTASHRDDLYRPSWMVHDEVAEPEPSPQLTVSPRDYRSNIFVEVDKEDLMPSCRLTLPGMTQGDLENAGTLFEGSFNQGEDLGERMKLNEGERSKVDSSYWLPSTDSCIQLENLGVVDRDPISSTSVPSYTLRPRNIEGIDDLCSVDESSKGRGPQIKHTFHQDSVSYPTADAHQGNFYQDNGRNANECPEGIYHGSQEAELELYSEDFSASSMQGDGNGQVQCMDDVIVVDDTDFLSPRQPQEMSNRQNVQSPDLFSTQQDEQEFPDHWSSNSEKLAHASKPSEHSLSGQPSSPSRAKSNVDDSYWGLCDQAKRNTTRNHTQDSTFRKQRCSPEVSYESKAIKTFQKRPMVARPSTSECNTPLPSIFCQGTPTLLVASQRSDTALDQCENPSSITMTGCDHLNGKVDEEANKVVETDASVGPQNTQDQHVSLTPAQITEDCFDHAPCGMSDSTQAGMDVPQSLPRKPSCGHIGSRIDDQSTNDIVTWDQNSHFTLQEDLPLEDIGEEDDAVSGSHTAPDCVVHTGTFDAWRGVIGESQDRVGTLQDCLGVGETDWQGSLGERIV